MHMTVMDLNFAFLRGDRDLVDLATTGLRALLRRAFGF
jgi:hypothetical protein